MNAEMEKLLQEAEQKGLWLLCDDLWFSPQELRNEQAHGNFRWGAVNWHLRNPEEQLDNLEKMISNAIREKEQFAARMRGWSDGLGG